MRSACPVRTERQPTASFLDLGAGERVVFARFGHRFAEASLMLGIRPPGQMHRPRRGKTTASKRADRCDCPGKAAP